MALRVLPDVEKICIDFLVGLAELDGHFNDRIHTELPAKPVYPLGLLSRIPGSAPVVRKHLDVARIQGEGWGNTKVEARLTAAMLQAALHELPGLRDLGTVTAVEDSLGLGWLPDPVTEKPRYVFEVLVYAHPNPS